MEATANIIIASAAVVLLGLGVYLALQDRTATTTVVFSFMFLLVVLLVVAKFKHIKGFGFEAEMWDEKQVQAAALVDRLSATSEAFSQQVMLIASKLGLWYSSLSNPELADLLDQTDVLLTSASTPKQRRDELLAPGYARIELNYWEAARQVADRAYRSSIDDVNKSVQNATGDDRTRIVARQQALNDEWGKLVGTSYQAFAQNKTVEPIAALVRDTKVLERREAVVADIEEIDRDLKFFMANRKLRRRVNFDYLSR